MWAYVFEAITNGGVWGYLIFLVGIVFYVFLVLQFFKAKTKDFRWILWGLFGFLLIAGSLGTIVGMQQACGAISNVAAEEQIAALSLGFSIAGNPMGLDLFFCGWAVIPLALATAKVTKQV